MEFEWNFHIPMELSMELYMDNPQKSHGIVAPQSKLSTQNSSAVMLRVTCYFVNSSIIIVYDYYYSLV